MNMFFLGFILGIVSFGIAGIFCSLPKIGRRDAPQLWDVVALVQSDGKWNVVKWLGDKGEPGRRVVLMRRESVSAIIEETKPC